MRVFVFWVAVCLTNSALAQSTPSLSPVRVSPQLSAEIGPHGRTYMACALQHIQRVATANPSTAFEQHEVSIRPACGAHVNRSRSRLFVMGTHRRMRISGSEMPTRPSDLSSSERLLPRPRSQQQRCRQRMRRSSKLSAARYKKRFWMTSRIACTSFREVVPFSDENA